MNVVEVVINGVRYVAVPPDAAGLLGGLAYRALLDAQRKDGAQVPASLLDLIERLRSSACAEPAVSVRGSAAGTGLGDSVLVGAPSPRDLTSAHVAKRLGITSRAVRKAAEAGRLRARKVAGRYVFDVHDVDAYARSRVSDQASDSHPDLVRAVASG